jgi:hypothetical protein
VRPLARFHRGVANAIITIIIFIAQLQPFSTLLTGVKERQPIKAPKAGSLFVRDNPPNTELRRFYERGDLPVSIEHRGVGNRIQWKVQFLDG